MPRYDRVYLTGFMGSGKSTVTPRLARCLEFTPIDLDEKISRYLGMSIPAIFDVLGEKEFRETESKMLHDLSKTTDVVISLGGGSITNPKNLDLCLESGLLVYMRASPSFLSHRLSLSKRNRPMLFGSDGQMLQGDALQDRISELLSERKSAYERAQLVVDIDDLSAEAVTRAIYDQIRDRTND